MRVAAIQLATDLEKDENTRGAVELVEEAARRGAKLVILPEATMCSFGGQTTELHPFAEPLDGPFVTALEKVASTSGTTVVAGMFEITADEHRVHNTVVAVGPSGLVGAYRKLHVYDALGWRESDRIKPGHPEQDGTLVFELGGFAVGVMNCYDLRFPELARTLAQRGATILAVPANWVNGPGKAETWTTLLRARAIENTAYVVAAAKPVPECAGHSMIIDPLGRVMTSMSGGGEGVLTADISNQVLESVRAELPVLGHSRFEVQPRR
jgi:deaminated glutathione amidase